VAENDGLTGKNGTTCKGINVFSTCACHTNQEQKTRFHRRLKNEIYLFSILVVQLHRIHPWLNLQKVHQVTKNKIKRD